MVYAKTQMSVEQFQRLLGLPENKKVGLYVDAANMFYTQQNLGWFFDPKKIMGLVEGPNQERYITVANWYTAVKWGGDQADFHAFLNAVGYTIHSKLIKEYTQEGEDGSGDIITNVKANMDVNICADFLGMMNRYDTAVLMSGDNDFSRMVEYAVQAGKRVVVISSDKSLGSELRNIASAYIDLNSLKDLVIKDRDRGKRPHTR